MASDETKAKIKAEIRKIQERIDEAEHFLKNICDESKVELATKIAKLQNKIELDKGIKKLYEDLL